jgi:hypothetical protein
MVDRAATAKTRRARYEGDEKPGKSDFGYKNRISVNLVDRLSRRSMGIDRTKAHMELKKLAYNFQGYVFGENFPQS